ncbi:MAG: FkbM family methyltransferase [Lacunisphaera sp.]|nr:FkbM family methyltransferase [Lacunisphaera sp.]
MASLSQLLLRACESLAFRLRRRARTRAVRGTPAAGTAAFDTYELLLQLRDHPPRVAYDLGGNRGQWTVLAKSIFPAMEIHAFEPLPEHCADYAAQTKALANVHLHAVALGDAAAELEMDLTTFSDSASLLAPTATMAETYDVRPGRKVRVPVVRLDDWVASHRLPPPDLLKLDLQGYELNALRGAPDCLHHARAVVLELSFREYYAGQPPPGALIAFLEQADFRLAAFSPDLPAGRPLEQADALFLRIP